MDYLFLVLKDINRKGHYVHKSELKNKNGEWSVCCKATGGEWIHIIEYVKVFAHDEDMRYATSFIIDEDICIVDDSEHPDIIGMFEIIS